MMQHRQEMKARKLGIESKVPGQMQEPQPSSSLPIQTTDLSSGHSSSRYSFPVGNTTSTAEAGSSDRPPLASTEMLEDLVSALKMSTPEKLLSDALKLDPSIMEIFQSLLGTVESGENASAATTSTILSLLTEFASNADSMQESNDASIQTTLPIEQSPPNSRGDNSLH